MPSPSVSDEIPIRFTACISELGKTNSINIKKESKHR
jgi:hypothetical protein